MRRTVDISEVRSEPRFGSGRGSVRPLVVSFLKPFRRRRHPSFFSVPSTPKNMVRMLVDSLLALSIALLARPTRNFRTRHFQYSIVAANSTLLEQPCAHPRAIPYNMLYLLFGIICVTCAERSWLHDQSSIHPAARWIESSGHHQCC